MAYRLERVTETGPEAVEFGFPDPVGDIEQQMLSESLFGACAMS
jgi:hypothetical protein